MGTNNKIEIDVGGVTVWLKGECVQYTMYGILKYLCKNKFQLCICAVYIAELQLTSQTLM